MLMGVTSWELGVLRVPLIMVPDTSTLSTSLAKPDSADFGGKLDQLLLVLQTNLFPNRILELESW
jgi:hypothetical protein